MKFLKSSVLFISMACIVPVCSIAREKSERITRAEIEQKSADEFINGLMSRMTVDEKIGQLNLPSYGNVMPNPKKSEIASRIVRGEVGGIFNIFGVDAIRQLQEVAVKESRLGIPIIVGADICNGYKTVFPIPLGLSCSWKPENIEEVARISAKEVGADGICWTYSPMVDISHDARWGRVKEGAGEDPFLGGIMAQAWVRGYQGNDLSADTTLMACVKHYALYGAAEAGRDYNTVDMSRVTAMNYYMRPYQAAVEAVDEAAKAAKDVIDFVSKLSVEQITAVRKVIDSLDHKDGTAGDVAEETELDEADSCEDCEAEEVEIEETEAAQEVEETNSEE